MRADTCPPDCPNRSITCHSTCQTYLRKKIKDELKRKKKQREQEKEQFFRDERLVVKRRKLAKKLEEARRKGYRD